jgi:hypothetical protein
LHVRFAKTSLLHNALLLPEISIYRDRRRPNASACEPLTVIHASIALSQSKIIHIHSEKNYWQLGKKSIMIREMGGGCLNMGKKIVSFILLILLMVVVWLGLMAVAQLTVGIVATMGIVVFGFILIPIAIRLLVNKVFKVDAGSKKQKLNI